MPLFFKNKNEAGFVISKEYTGIVLIIANKVYKFRSPAIDQNILSAILKPDVEKEIAERLTNSISHICNSENYEDTKALHEPYHLYLES